MIFGDLLFFISRFRPWMSAQSSLPLWSAWLPPLISSQVRGIAEKMNQVTARKKNMATWNEALNRSPVTITFTVTNSGLYFLYLSESWRSEIESNFFRVKKGNSDDSTINSSVSIIRPRRSVSARPSPKLVLRMFAQTAATVVLSEILTTGINVSSTTQCYPSSEDSFYSTHSRYSKIPSWISSSFSQRSFPFFFFSEQLSKVRTYCTEYRITNKRI